MKRSSKEWLVGVSGPGIVVDHRAALVEQTFPFPRYSTTIVRTTLCSLHRLVCVGVVGVHAIWRRNKNREQWPGGILRQCSC